MSTIQPSDPHRSRIRASDSDRNQVMDLLAAAYAEGRLTKDEYDERLESATQAVTFGDLVPLTTDLVPLPSPSVPRRTDANLPVIDRSNPTTRPDTILDIFGGSTRRGPWRVPRQIQSYAVFGGSDLDFTEAIFEDDVIEISGFWIFGGMDLKVPEGVNVRDETVNIFGGNDTHGIAPSPDGPTIVLKGLCLFGGNDVYGPRHKSFWKRMRGDS